MARWQPKAGCRRSPTKVLSPRSLVVALQADVAEVAHLAGPECHRPTLRPVGARGLHGVQRVRHAGGEPLQTEAAVRAGATAGAVTVAVAGQQAALPRLALGEQPGLGDRRARA